MKIQSSLIFFIVLSWTAASGCAPLGTQAPESVPPAVLTEAAPETDTRHSDAGEEPTEVVRKSPPVPQAQFEPDTLFGLLVAEVAGYRNQFDVALANYLGQARRTRDPGIAERAARIAQYVGVRSAALEAARIWAAGDPGNAEAHKLAAKILIEQNNFEAALHHLEQMLELEGAAGFDFLALNAQDLNDDERAGVVSAFDKLLAAHPNNPQLLFGKAILLRQSNETAAALVLAERIVQLAPDYVQGHILYGRLLQETGESDAAVASLADSIARFPGDPTVRQQYARTLIDVNRIEEAAQQFQLLVNSDPGNADLRYSLALVFMELGRLDEASMEFSTLIEAGQRTDEANYYLGTIEEDRGNFAAALDYYARVSPSGSSLGAPTRIARLKAEHEGMESMRAYLDVLRDEFPELEVPLALLEIEVLMERKAHPEAMDAVNAALQREPDDVNLLYARAMVAEKAGDLSQLEEDLGRILVLDPENAAALNALGYTLADRTDRYQEAFELISRAMELKPDDPAITDSLGWVQYRLGNYPEALRLLRQAFDQFPDHEVAAHLGEVLWVTGNQPEARRVWLEALQKTPDSELLQRVMRRFQVQID